MVYEPESGLVYNETVSQSCNCLRRFLDRPRDAPSRNSNPHVSCRRDTRVHVGNPQSFRERSQRSGDDRVQDRVRSERTPTLWDMSRRHLLRNVNELSPEALKAVPSALCERIWPVKERSLISNRLWKVMAKAQPMLLETPREWEYVCKSCRRLADIIQLAECAAFHWLTSLTLDGRHVTYDELFRVPSLRNIRSISVRGRLDFSVTDRVIRSWADAAAEQGAFAKLELMFVDNGSPGQHGELTVSSLDRLDALPNLQYFCANGMSPHHKRHESYNAGGSFKRIDSKGCPCLRLMHTFDKPLLQVSVGPIDPSWPRHSSYSACFQRQVYASSAAGKSRHKRATESEPAVKRRKMKSGKSLALGDLLEGM